MLKGTGISDGIGLGKAIIFKSQKIKLEKNKRCYIRKRKVL